MHIKSLVLAFALVACATGNAAETPAADTVLNTLRAAHPRLMMTDDDLAALKVRYPSDPALARIVRDTIAEADEYLEAKPLVHKLAGPRLLSVSRACVDRIYTLCTAYRWTGDERYARAAKANALTVCAFPDWNPSHFLDTAEMSHAVGIAYDWLYDYLGEANRARIADQLEALGIDPALEAYKDGRSFYRSEYNWNQVCNGGMLTAALAIAEHIPEKAGVIVSNAVRLMPRALASYGPDGVWAEGPSYWHYATRYTAYGLTALETALGSTFGLTEIEGMAVTGDFPIYMTGPTGLYFNFADVGERSKRYNLPCLFWLARTYDNPFYSDTEHAMIAQRGGHATHLMWYVPPTGGDAPKRDLDRYFAGKVEIVVMRSAWDDPDALWVGVKAGYNQANHGHLDLGSFEMEALGVRWVRDLGSDDYNLPGYWDRKQGGARWQYYRLNSFSHKIPIIGGKNQHAEGRAKVTRIPLRSTGRGNRTEIDMTAAYPGLADSVVRSVEVTSGRKSVVVQDVIKLRDGAEIAWGITTDAEIEIENGRKAILRLGGKRMVVTLDTNAPGMEFSVESAEQAPPEKRNRGVQRLVAKGRLGPGAYTITVTFSPAGTG